MAQLINRRTGFTLVELVVAMGVIVVISALTLMAVRNVSRNARQSSGVNAVVASLDNARALAMKENKIVAVVFRPRLDGPNEMIVEAVLVEWSGQTAIVPDFFGQGDVAVVDRFVPVKSMKPRPLPRGVKVAGPLYGEMLPDGSSPDEAINAPPTLPVWTTQPNLPTIHQETGAGEPPGQLFGVMYGPDGATVSRNSKTDAHFMFVDFNNDRVQQIGDDAFDYGTTFPSQPTDSIFDQFFESDETMFGIAPFIAVYDDEEARSLRAGPWEGNIVNYNRDLVGPQGFISTRADRIHFNRYSGVVMK